jgi:hypothetical protein
MEKLAADSKRKDIERRMERLKEQYQAVKEQIQALGYVLPGSVIRRLYRCGKPSCRCQQDPSALHGPYYQWTRKVKGKTVGMNVDCHFSPVVRGWIKNDRALRRFIGRMHQLTLQRLKLSQEAGRIEKPVP